MQALDVSRGRARGERSAGGLVLGAIAGGALGLLGGTVAARGRNPGDEGAIVKALGTVGGVAVGAAIGTAIGASTAKERW